MGGVSTALPVVAEFARSLRDLRQAAGEPSISWLAQAAGYSRTAVSDALSGRRKPTRPVVQAIVTALGGDPQLWGGRWDVFEAAVQEARRSAVTRTGPDGSPGCQVEGCPNTPRGRWCSTHRLHYRLYGDPTAGRFSPKSHPQVCSIEGCEKPYRSLGLCQQHYRRQRAREAAAART